MSTAFSRSVRLMNQDGFNLSLVSLVFLFIFLSAWMIWFFMARMPIYATSNDYQVTKTGSLNVTFSDEDLLKILPGQSAELALPESAGSPTQTLKAKVMGVPTPGHKFVEVYVFGSTGQPELDKYAGGNVKIQVEEVSPASLVLRSTKQIQANP